MTMRRKEDHAADLPDVAFRRQSGFNRRRFEDLVRYVCWICEDPRVLGLERLNRILWYVDRGLYLTRETAATGASYLRHRSGPWAKPIKPVLQDLERQGMVARRARAEGGEPDLLLALSKPDLGRFNAEEVSFVEAVTRAICFESRGTIPDRAAHDTVLAAARPGEVIPYFSVYAGRAGEVTRADVGWALREAGRWRGTPLATGAVPLLPKAEEALGALMWHLLRDPSLGISVPTTEASWFVHKQLGPTGIDVPDITLLYRFEADELVIGAVQIGALDEDDEEGAGLD